MAHQNVAQTSLFFPLIKSSPLCEKLKRLPASEVHGAAEVKSNVLRKAKESQHVTQYCVCLFMETLSFFFSIKGTDLCGTNVSTRAREVQHIAIQEKMYNLDKRIVIGTFSVAHFILYGTFFNLFRVVIWL